MHGFHGRLLHIDLSTGHSSWRDLEESRLRAFLHRLGRETNQGEIGLVIADEYFAIRNYEEPEP